MLKEKTHESDVLLKCFVDREKDIKTKPFCCPLPFGVPQIHFNSQRKQSESKGDQRFSGEFVVYPEKRKQTYMEKGDPKNKKGKFMSIHSRAGLWSIPLETVLYNDLGHMLICVVLDLVLDR